MQIENRFTLAAPPDRALDLLLDVERIVPCMPGAQLQERDGDAYTGEMKVKVGPITALYTGTVEFIEVDRDGLRVVIHAAGREVRGQGMAEATVLAQISAIDDHSVVDLTTDLNLRGRLAQFGRGVLADVSQGIVDQFARNLQESIASDQPEASTHERDGAVPGEAPSTRLDERSDAALSVSLWPIAKRVVPVAVALAVLAWVLRRLF